MPLGLSNSFMFPMYFKWSILEILSEIVSSLLDQFLVIDDAENIDIFIHSFTSSCITEIFWIA